MAQPANNPPTMVSPSTDLRPALSQVQETTANLDIRRWKTSRGIRGQAQADVDSIQHDLTQTLPGLLVPADAVPESVPSSFTVYRNIDALYDVLLRVSEVADFAAPRDEAEAIAASLQELQAARSRLGDAILRVSQHHEAQMKEFKVAIRAARVAAAKPPHETVITDGPVRSSRRRKHKGKREIHPRREQKPDAGTPKGAMR
ncbi:MAG TPA: hypothetical protein VMU92_09990 [Acidobacteriaceae bacterium]|nr:hypothetical protein [Acidobacteriaceae bacterium]